MKQDVRVEKGTRVRVRRFVAKPLGSYSIAGAQMKVVATHEEFDGNITHIRGDHPTAPTVIEFTIMKDDGTEVVVPQAAIVAVIED